MAETKCSRINHFLCICICIFFTTFCNNIQASLERGVVTDYSNRFLTSLPKNLPAQTTVFNLSHNIISELRISDFRYLSKLKVLILSHNIIRKLDLSVFQYNKDLERLDLSYNSLSDLSCHPLTNLRYLDLSYNDYTAVSICPDFGKMSKLEYLGLSARRIERSDFSSIVHLQLDFLFLGLEDLTEYRHLPVFNTKSLQIALPQNTNVSIFSDLELNVTESLELSNIQGKLVLDLYGFLKYKHKHKTKYGRLLNLTLNNIEVSWDTFTDILLSVWKTTIEYFNIYNMTFLNIIHTVLRYPHTSLKALAIKGTKLTNFDFNQSYVYRTFSEMNIGSLTISDSQILYMPCPLKPSSIFYLCLSRNTLSETGFQGCNHLTLLETLILQKNNLKLLTKVSSMTSLMKSLKVLDVSQNLLQYEDGNECSWANNLVNLNLSFNMLSSSVFRCLPITTQMLDLQHNQISSVPEDIIDLINLEELNLAFNRLTHLPGCGQFRNLRLMNVEINSISFQSSEFFQSCQNIKRLQGGHNPFKCSCELRQFINLEKHGVLELVGWPQAYVCENSDDLRGTLLMDFHISEVACNMTLLIVIVLVITVVFAATVSFLCIHFDIQWYVKMIWQWTQFKHRVWSSKPEDIVNDVHFHAFISYSEHDSDWVKSVLIPNLEKEDGSIRLCQHERNFVAGKSIVENIIDCIEKSYKSLFVLSPNFVQSEWCHYELYFAHHNLFRENADNLILLLLEPIPEYIIPTRYHKLKALMAKRTYLEWPKEKSKHGLFWANLKASIHIKLPSTE